MNMIRFTLNGAAAQADVPGDTPMLWVIREELNLLGTKFGCGKGLCGACTVHLNGQAVRSCVLPASAVQGQSVHTIESLSDGAGGLHPLQTAWHACNVSQCGYCQPGQLMSAAALLKTTPNPSDKDIDDALSGNLCRCGTYPRVVVAIKQAAGKADGKAPAAAQKVGA
jgi:isoquinoline 1-oxidoreductase subunit alpha